jgi:hypothetical protein
MSLTVFLWLCILGLDFIIYAFFQWIYGDKRSAIARQIGARKNASMLPGLGAKSSTSFIRPITERPTPVPPRQEIMAMGRER